jgi:hypothetical protein
VQQQRTVGDTFSQQSSGNTIVDNMKLNLLVASGGVLSHAPRMNQTAMMLVDAFEPEGCTNLAKDSIFMMPHLGVLSAVHPLAASQVFERDCLVYLGTCIAAKGIGKAGKPCFTWSLTGDVTASGTCNFGDLELIEMGPEQNAMITCEPIRGFDLGGGNGKKVTHEVRGGTVGLIIDGRGRPLGLPEDRQKCQQQISEWVENMALYEEMEQAVATA